MTPEEKRARYHQISLEGAAVCNAAWLAASLVRDREMEPINKAMKAASVPGSGIDFAPITAAMTKVEARYDKACQKANKVYDVLMKEAWNIYILQIEPVNEEMRQMTLW